MPEMESFVQCAFSFFWKNCLEKLHEQGSKAIFTTIKKIRVLYLLKPFPFQ